MKLTRAQTVYGAINSVADLIEYPQLRVREMPVNGEQAWVPAPPFVTPWDAPAYRAAPALGAHSEALREEFAPRPTPRPKTEPRREPNPAPLGGLVAVARWPDDAGFLGCFSGLSPGNGTQEWRAMTILPKSSSIAHYIDDELLRAPLIWDQLLDAILDRTRPMRASMTQAARIGNDDMARLLEENWSRMAAAYLGSLRIQAQQAFPSASPTPPKLDTGRGRGKKLVLELVGLDSIALDVELSKLIQAIKDEAEHELRDLQAFLATVVGDMDIEEDHNPLHPAVHGRALRCAAQVMPLQQQQLGFVRIVTQPFAQLLRQTYAASCARLEEAGIEPASHRCVVLPNGKRHLQLLPEVAYVPDLQRIRDAMPRSARSALSRERVRRLTRGVGEGEAAAGQGRAATHAGASESGALEREQARDHRARGMADRQAVELVNRLFKAFPLDERVPGDVLEIIAQLRGPAMRLTLRDPLVLDSREHPLWRLIHLFAYQAEMVPKVDDRERLHWLKFGRQTIEELTAAPLQKTTSYQVALERTEEFLRERLASRCAALATRFKALQSTEAGLAATQASGAAKAPYLDTVLAALLPRTPHGRLSADQARLAAEAWFKGLVPGQWLRLLLKGTWLHAQLLWQGERRQIAVLGDGATETTWALRRGVLLTMHRHGLAKTLQMRSLVGTAALRVQEQIAIADAA